MQKREGGKIDENQWEGFREQWDRIHRIGFIYFYNI